jgi:hypothetical protein
MASAYLEDAAGVELTGWQLMPTTLTPGQRRRPPSRESRRT